MSASNSEPLNPLKGTLSQSSLGDLGTFFDIENIFFEVLGYPMSYLEFFGTLAGILAIWLSAKALVWNFPVGIINVILFFFLFYQVQLYPDMFLYAFYFVTNLIGWWRSEE